MPDTAADLTGLSPDVMALRQRVIEIRRAYLLDGATKVGAERTTLDQVYAAVDAYLDACEAKAKRLWPNRKYRRPSRSYILRAL